MIECMVVFVNRVDAQGVRANIGSQQIFAARPHPARAPASPSWFLNLAGSITMLIALHFTGYGGTAVVCVQGQCVLFRGPPVRIRRRHSGFAAGTGGLLTGTGGVRDAVVLLPSFI
jgi:hypothetical protein